MKNRRIAIIAFVLVAVMAIGVGYAALADTLTITGSVSSATNNAFDEAVYIKTAAVDPANTDNDASSVTLTPSAEAGETSNDKLAIVIPNGVLVNKGDKVTIDVTIENDSDLAALIKTLTVSEETGEADMYLVEHSGVTAGTTTVAANGGTVKFTITVTLDETPDGVGGDNVGFEFIFGVESVDN